MQIIWKGQSCFQIVAQRSKQEQVKIVTDPFDPVMMGLRISPLEADIALISHGHPDHNNLKALKTEAFVISNPGEYEVKDVFVYGISSFHDDAQGKERGLNTIYTIEAEGIRICHLGDLGQHELTNEQIEKIGTVHILMIPVGGEYTIGAKEAVKIVHQIEPEIVIPMHYAVAGSKVKLEKIDAFLKEMGVKEAVPQQKFIVKERDLGKEEVQVIVLEP